MHLPIRDFLRQLEQDYRGDPLGFLWEFAPVHEWWHEERMRGTQPAGFLTFHHLVIESLGSTFPSGSIPVQPATPFPFPSALASAAQSVSGVQELQDFAEDLERWHNGVHNSIGGTFVNPTRNVFQRLFWQFHTFLDGQFEVALGAMGLDFRGYFDGVGEQQQRLI
jgi:hypothetical protein